jgi:ribosomal protein S3
VFVYCGQPGKLNGQDNANVPTIVKEINKIVGRKIKVNLNVLAYENTA